MTFFTICVAVAGGIMLAMAWLMTAAFFYVAIDDRAIYPGFLGCILLAASIFVTGVYFYFLPQLFA